MSTWSDPPVRSSVLRGGAAIAVRPARLDSDLRTTPFAPSHVVDARLTDPHLQNVVAEAAQAATARGYTAGHAEGYAAGLLQAATEAAAAESARETQATQAQAVRDARLAEALSVLQAATEAMQRREAVAVEEVEDVVVDLALSLARTVLDRELALCADAGAQALARALALAPEGTPAIARLHPGDAAAVQDLPVAGRDLQIVADPAVEPGGCVVDTAGRRIDAQVGAALERAAAVLR